MRLQTSVSALLLLGALHLFASFSTAARSLTVAAYLGPQHHLARCANGDVWGWGSNAAGQLGQDPRALPQQRQPRALAGLTDVMATAVSLETSFALLSTGTVLAWGGNDRGELGIGYSSSPIWLYVQPGNLSHVVSIAAGDHHAVAVRDDGTVWAWGANEQGQLGDGTTTDRAGPVPVLNRATRLPLRNIVKVVSSGNHTLAVDAGGQAYTWGSNGSGELGTGSGASFEMIASAVPLRGVYSIAAGAFHCLVIDQRGQTYAWGDNTYGQLGPLQNGMNTTTSSEYYLNHTDFEGNLQGVFDWYKGVALADEGVHYCSFASNYPNVKFPFNQPAYNLNGSGGGQRPQPGFNGIQFFSIDDSNGNQGADYAAARVDHNTFHHLNTGIIGSARNLRVNDNTFDYIRFGIDNPNLSFRAIPMYIENNTITLRGSDPYFAGLLGIGGNVFMRGNRISGSDANPAAHPQTMVGIEVNEIDGSAQTGNTLERLNVGVSVLLTPFNSWGVADISGNLLRDCYQGMRFGSSIYNGFQTSGTLRLRCNTFQNPARLPGSVGLYIESGTSQFPSEIGGLGDANGNKFGVNGVLEPSFTPVFKDPSLSSFTYFSCLTSSQEIFPMYSNPAPFLINRQAGNPT